MDVLSQQNPCSERNLQENGTSVLSESATIQNIRKSVLRSKWVHGARVLGPEYNGSFAKYIEKDNKIIEDIAIEDILLGDYDEKSC